MKIYSITLDWREPLRQKIWVPPHSDFGIALKLMKDGRPLDESRFRGAVFKGGRDQAEIEPEDERIGGFKVYAQKSGEPGETLYLVDVLEYAGADPVRVKTFYVTVVTTSSTVFDVGGGGKIDPKVVPTYETTEAGQTLVLGETRYDTLNLAGFYEDGEGFSYNVLADKIIAG